MNRFQNHFSRLNWLTPLAFVAILTSCGGQDAVLGNGPKVALAPTVTLVAPSDNTTGVAVHNPIITATFNEPMAALTNGTTLVVTCASPCADPAGTTTLDSTGRVISFVPTSNLAPLTSYTATVSGAKSLATGLAITSPYVWHFTTGAAPAAVTVTTVVPSANSVAVPINIAAIRADLSESVAFANPATGFTLTCAAPCVNPTGTVVLNSTNNVASFTPSAPLTPLTQYTATVSGVTSLTTGATLVTPHVWQFTTATVPDITRPRVTSTMPATTNPGPTMNVATNVAVSAIFSESVGPASVNSGSFTVTCAAPCVNPVGNVSYIGTAKTAVFTPTNPFASNTTYTAKITTAVVDLSANALAGNQAPLPAASDYIWTFTTGTAAPAADVTVFSTNPMANALTVCPSDSINATFNVPSGSRMNPASLNGMTFTVTESASTINVVTPASVLLDDATGRIATFDPAANLTVGTTYTATIKSGATGVKDLAIPANQLAADVAWNFTVAACLATPAIIIPLGTAATFGTFGGSAGTTNQGIYTVINGDIGTTAVSTAVTGFHDGGVGCTYTETTLNVGTVNGKIYTAPPSPTVSCPTEGTAVTAAIAAEARDDALIAYNALVAQPGGPDPGFGNLANLVLEPGVYTSAAGSFMIQGGDLTLDAKGNANAVWVFQMATTLTVGGPGAAAPQSIVLVNGAQAKNVYWQVGSAATINAGGGGTMAGTIISQSGAAVSTDGNVALVTINGRVLSLNASVTLVNTVINVPAP